MGTLDAYYEANMDVAGVTPTFNLYDKSWPMRTRAYQYPPAKFVFGEIGRTGMAINSIVASGSIVSGSVVRNSVVSHDVRCNSYSDVDSSVVFAHVNIGRHCRIRHAIIDRDVHIPDGTVIGYDPGEDRKNYFVTPSGLTVVTRDGSVYENPVSPEFMQTGGGFLEDGGSAQRLPSRYTMPPEMAKNSRVSVPKCSRMRSGESRRARFFERLKSRLPPSANMGAVRFVYKPTVSFGGKGVSVKSPCEAPA